MIDLAAISFETLSIMVLECSFFFERRKPMFAPLRQSLSRLNFDLPTAF